MTTNLDQLNAAVRAANLADRLGTHAERLAARRAAVADVERIRAAIRTEAQQAIDTLTDGRKLTPLAMLELGRARRTLAWLAESTR